MAKTGDPGVQTLHPVTAAALAVVDALLGAQRQGGRIIEGTGNPAWGILLPLDMRWHHARQRFGAALEAHGHEFPDDGLRAAVSRLAAWSVNLPPDDNKLRQGLARLRKCAAAEVQEFMGDATLHAEVAQLAAYVYERPCGGLSVADLDGFPLDTWRLRLLTEPRSSISQQNGRARRAKNGKSARPADWPLSTESRRVIFRALPGPDDAAIRKEDLGKRVAAKFADPGSKRTMLRYLQDCRDHGLAELIGKDYWRRTREGEERLREIKVP